MQLRRQTVEEFRELTGARVVQGYGMTETSPVTMANPLDGNARHVSIGLPMPGTQARIVSETDPRVPMAAGLAGELLIQGPQVFRGYWKQPEETAEVLVDGWIRTGDIAMMSPDGFFTLIDRKRDVIIVDGFNVYPSEIEEVLNTHPAVAESAVIGVPDPTHGERVHAYAVLRPGEALEVSELIRFCAERLTDYKVPEDIQVRPELPHNILGKVLRRVLREEHTEETAPGPGESWHLPAAQGVPEPGSEPATEVGTEAGSGPGTEPGSEPADRSDPAADGHVPQAGERIPQADRAGS
jgi:long-chain acyl-CoA synthetase